MKRDHAKYPTEINISINVNEEGGCHASWDAYSDLNGFVSVESHHASSLSEALSEIDVQLTEILITRNLIRAS